MTTGCYLLSGHDGAFAVERFSCAEESTGWRYTGVREHPTEGTALGRLELLVEPSGRVLRLEVVGGGWELRGGVVGPEVLWRRGDDERTAQAHGFTGTSPAYAVVATRLASTAELLRLVEVHDAVLATSVVDQRWVGQGESWTSERRDTGEVGRWRVVGGVVAAGPGVALLPE